MPVNGEPTRLSRVLAGNNLVQQFNFNRSGGLLNSFQALNLGTNDEPSTTTTQPTAQPAAQPTSSGTSWGPCNFRQPSEIEEYYSKGVGKILKLTRPQEWRAMVTAFEDEARSKQAKSEDAVSSSSLVSPRNLLPLSEAIRTIATFPFAPPITGPPHRRSHRRQSHQAIQTAPLHAGSSAPVARSFACSHRAGSRQQEEAGWR
jgi:hypothetical protein